MHVRISLVIAAMTFAIAASPAQAKHHRYRHRTVTLDANGNTSSKVCASGGRHCVSVEASAQPILQCVVNHVEAAGVRIKVLGGYRAGRCSSRHMHSCGKAIDINQYARDRGGPPRSVSNAAASACGAVSGSWWASNPDNGHFQVGGWAGTHGHGTQTYAARRHHRHARIEMASNSDEWATAH